MEKKCHMVHERKKYELPDELRAVRDILGSIKYQEKVNAETDKASLGDNLNATEEMSQGMYAIAELIENGKIGCEKRYGDDIPEISIDIIDNIDASLNKTGGKLLYVKNTGDSFLPDTLDIEKIKKAIKQLVDYGFKCYHKTASSNFDTGYKAANGYLTSVDKESRGVSRVYTRTKLGWYVIDTTHWPKCPVSEVQPLETWPFERFVTVMEFEVIDVSKLKGVDSLHITRMFFPDLYESRILLTFNGKNLCSRKYLDDEYLSGVKVKERVVKKINDNDNLRMIAYRFETVDNDAANVFFKINPFNQGCFNSANGRLVEHSRVCVIKRADGKYWSKTHIHPGFNGIQYLFDVVSYSGEYMEYPYTKNDKSAISWNTKFAQTMKELENEIAGDVFREAQKKDTEEMLSALFDNIMGLAMCATDNLIYVPQARIPVEITSKLSKATRIPDGLLCEKNKDGKPDFQKVHLIIEFKTGEVKEDGIDQAKRYGEYLRLKKTNILMIGRKLSNVSKIHIDNIHKNAKVFAKMAELCGDNLTEEEMDTLCMNNVHISFVPWKMVNKELHINPDDLADALL